MPPLRSTTSPAAKVSEPISAARSSLAHEVGRRTDRDELLPERLEVGGAGVGVGEVEVPGPLVRAVDAVRDERLDVVEGVLHLLVQPQAEVTVPPLERARAGLQLRQHHPAVARAGAPPEVMGVEERHRPPAPRQLGGRRQPRVAATHDHHVHRTRELRRWPPDAVSPCPATALGAGSPRSAGSSTAMLVTDLAIRRWIARYEHLNRRIRLRSPRRATDSIGGEWIR